MEKVSMSHEDYLEAIVMLGGSTTSPVRSVDVATKLGVSKASVSKAISLLKDQGLVDQPYYGDITLTEEFIRRTRDVSVPYRPSLPTPAGAARDGFVRTMTAAGLL